MSISNSSKKNKSSLHRIDKNNIDIKESEIIAFSCVRNEHLRLPYFLEYHRNLGVDRFVFIDNASTDDTKDYLLSQDDAHVFYTEASYADSKCGIDWLNQLLSEFGSNHWTLTLDADELLIYPKCENVNLHLLTKYLDTVEAQGLVSFMLDMYSDTTIKKTIYAAGSPFLETCNYFDSDSYYKYNDKNIPSKGGPRYRLFWEGYNRENTSPYYINIPLVKWRKDLMYVSGTHTISNVKFASLTGVKQHFKFFSDFYEYAEAETERKEHWNNASEYASYWDVLSKNQELSGMYKGSLNYIDSMQLVELGLMKMPEDFESFINKHIKTAY